MNLEIKHFFDQETYTLTYLVYDKNSQDALIIDPVLNYDQASSKTSTESIEEVKAFITQHGLNAHFILETHAHADHLTGSIELKKIYPQLKIAIGKNIVKVQETFKAVFNLKDLNTNGVQFDVLLDEDQALEAGSITVKTIFTPGHTPACSSYLIGDMLFTGDALFMPDFGTGRCDFPMGSAKDLYHSIHDKLYKLPEETRFYTGHDYRPNGRELRYMATIGESKQNNIQLKESTTEEEFVKFREERDAKLSAPKLLLPSVQINIDGGRIPVAEDNGVSYIKIPVR